MESNNKPETPKSRTTPFFTILIFFLMGFLTLNKKHDTSTTEGIILVTLGWLFVGLSMVLSVIVLVRIFKEQFNRK